jgi:hypothetical protein
VRVRDSTALTLAPLMIKYTQVMNSYLGAP